jgi:hypothetical protein
MGHMAAQQEATKHKGIEEQEIPALLNAHSGHNSREML